MRVLLASCDDPYVTRLGGKHIHLLLLERGLRALGFQVDRVYYDSKSATELLRKLMLRFTPFPEWYKYNSKLNRTIHCIQRQIPQTDYDILHAHDVLAISAIANMKQKKVLTIHGYFARENIEYVKKEAREKVYPILLEFEKEGVESADHIITVDKRLSEYLVTEFGYRKSNISVLHNCIDTERFRPVSTKEKLDLRKRLGYDVDSIIVLVPRRLVEKNGVIYAVRAMKHLENKNLLMVIAGDGPEKKNIVNEIGGDPRIRLLGTIPHDKIDAYFMISDVILIPSITSHGIQEASSLAMLEAMSAGKVVICSNIGGMHEIVQNMVNGVLVEEKNSVAIAEAIENIIENKNLEIEIGIKAREYAMNNHSFIAYASKITKIYNGVINN
ncbi:MAG: glycosyltransferase family 4 protein [Candidatus Methanosuratus sp.]|nr:glycosyltransferase family 4 protein [Candidatus Methanosuratincola sp.]